MSDRCCRVEVRSYYCVETAVHTKVVEPWTVPFKRSRKPPSLTTGFTFESHQIKNPKSLFDIPSQPAGNLATQRLLRSGVIRPKLAVSQPGDVHEQEADRVADQVMRMPEASLQPSCSACEAGGTQCPKCEAEKSVRLKTEASANPTGMSVPDSFVQSLGSGQPLDTATRASFESRFGADLSDVRVHTDEKAAESARSVNALAYTVGNDIVFSAQQYDPGSYAGRKLLSHELVHAIQQNSLFAKALTPNEKDHPAVDFDSEADETASSKGRQSGPLGEGSSSPRLARQTPGGSTSGTSPVAASPQELMNQGNALRMQFLQRAALRVRQLQIACEKQTDPFLLIQALPDEVRAFVSWLGVMPGEGSFCVLVDWVKRLIEQNMRMVVPPFFFATLPDQLCSLGNELPLANFEQSQIRICPGLVDSQRSNTTLRALILIHEMFHDPSFRMEHPTLDVMNSAHCGFMGSFEAVSNPYCVTNLIGQLGGGDQATM